MERFDFIASDEFRACLVRDAGELLACMEARAWKAAHVLAGSLIHAVLIDYLTSSGKAAEEELLRLTFSDLLGLCRKEQVLSERTVELATFIRSYPDLLNPGRRVRLQATSDETGARFAQALLEIVIQEVSVHKHDTPTFTAEQVIAKLQADPSSAVIIRHLLQKLSRFELERLLGSLLPKVYFEMSKLAEPEAGQTLKNLEHCFRLGFELAPPELKRDIAARFVYILENESEYVVGAYESCFFRGSDLEFLTEEERAIVKAHFFSSLTKEVTPPLVNAASGMGAFLVSEQDARAFFVPLVLAFLGVKDEVLAAAIRMRIAEEYALLAEQYRRTIGAWADRLRSFLQSDVRRSGSLAIERLKSALIGLPESA